MRQREKDVSSEKDFLRQMDLFWKKKKVSKKSFSTNFFEKQKFVGIFWKKNIFLFLGLNLEH